MSESSNQPRPLPLAGVRVADLTWIIAGPYGSYLLARMGAEVIKIEGLDPGDHTRENPPHAEGIPGLNRSGFFNFLNAGKKSVSLQLSDPEQAELAKKIIATCDIAIEAFSCGTMEKFALGYDALRAVKQDLIMISCAGFGQRGRDRSLRAFMGTVHAYTGLNSLNGYVDGPPKPAGGTLADYISGTAIVFSALAALRRRRKTGCGQYIDLSMSDALISTMGTAFMDYFLNGRSGEPQGNRSPHAAPNDVYRCRGDDAWVAISVETDAQWEALRAVVGDQALDRPEYADVTGRQQHASAIDERITAWSRLRRPLEATELLQAAGVPSGPSSSAGDLVAQPQLRSRGFFITPDHPEVGPIPIPNLPWRLASRPDARCAPAPLLGQHNQEVLSSLGTPQATIDKLNARRDEVLNRGL